MNAPARRRAVLVICDGLRRDLIAPGRSPHLAALAERSRRFERHRSVFPSVTRSSAASVATGCHPARHGLHGNTMALPDGEGYAVYNVGPPEFVGQLLALTGRTLRVPTLAERLRGRGGVVVYSNVSPGAAYFHDPDGHGHVYHRAGSYGPGRNPVPAAEHLDVTHDAAGDARMTERFCAEVLQLRRPALAVLWLSEPDLTQHKTVMGSPDHLAAIRAADACVARVTQTVDTLRDEGEDILYLVGSDHGHESIAEIVAVERELHEAGLKTALTSNDIVVAPQGTSVLVYFSPAAEPRVEAVAAYLRRRPWAGAVYVGDELAHIGMRAEDGLHIAVSMAKRAEPNEHGVAGLSTIGVRYDVDPGKLGFGQHGGIGDYEQQPFLFVDGAGHAGGTTSTEPSSIVDIAPTVLAYLGIETPAGTFDGRPLPLR
jgi:arylsulfatase A-like enzyme